MKVRIMNLKTLLRIKKNNNVLREEKKEDNSWERLLDHPLVEDWVEPIRDEEERSVEVNKDDGN